MSSHHHQPQQEQHHHQRLVPLQPIPLLSRSGHYRKREGLTEYMPIIALSKEELKDRRRQREEEQDDNSNKGQPDSCEDKINLKLDLDESSATTVEEKVKNNVFRKLQSSSSPSDPSFFSSTVAACSDANTWWIADASKGLDKEMYEMKRFRLDLKPSAKEKLSSSSVNQTSFQNLPTNITGNNKSLQMSKVAQIQLQRIQELGMKDSRFGGEEFFAEHEQLRHHQQIQTHTKKTGFFHPATQATVLSTRFILEPAGLILSDSDWLRLQDGPEDLLVGNSAGPKQKARHLPLSKAAHERWDRLLRILRQAEEVEDDSSSLSAPAGSSLRNKKIRTLNNKNNNTNTTIIPHSVLKMKPEWSTEIYCYVTSPLSTNSAHWIPLETILEVADPSPDENRNLLIATARELESCAAELLRRRLLVCVELLKLGLSRNAEDADAIRRSALWAWYSCQPEDGIETMLEYAGSIKRDLAKAKKTFNKKQKQNNKIDEDDKNMDINAKKSEKDTGRGSVSASAEEEAAYDFRHLLKPQSVMWDLLAELWKIDVQYLHGRVRYQDCPNENIARIVYTVGKARNMGRTMSSVEVLQSKLKYL